MGDGIKMRTVDSFEWTRDATTQTAIESGAAAGNLLTSFDEATCEGGDYCQFSSILFAAFYATEGQVSVTALPRCNSVREDVLKKERMDFVVAFKSKRRRRPPNLILPFPLLPSMTVQLCCKPLRVHQLEP